MDGKTEIITPHNELLQLIKDGYFFNFCIAFALNKGYKDAIKEKKQVKFEVGNYDVEFNNSLMCFVLSHQVYFARIIIAYYNEVVFIGDDEQEVINELLLELMKESKCRLDEQQCHDTCHGDGMLKSKCIERVTK